MVLHIWVNHEKEQIYADAEPLLQGRRPDLWVQWLSTSWVHTAKEKKTPPKRWWKLGPWKMGHGYWDLTSILTPMGKQYNTTEWIWLQRWCAAQLSISLEILPTLEHLLCLTHLTMYPASELTCRLSDLLHPIYPAKQQNHWWFIDCYPCFHTSWCCP